MVSFRIGVNNDSKDYARIFRNRFGELSKAIQKDVIANIHHGEDLPIGKSYDTKNLTINIWASHKTEDMAYVESNTAFGKVFCNDALFLPTDGFVHFVENDGMALAEYDAGQNVLNFLYDMWEYESTDEIDLFDKIMDMFIEHLFGSMDAYREALNKAEEIEREESIKRAVANLMQTMKNDKKNIEDKVKNLRRDIEEHMSRVKHYSMSVISLELQLEGFAKGEEGIREKLLKEIKAMQANKKVESIFFAENGNLLIDTKELFAKVKCEDKKIRRYRMGKFRVEVTLGNGRVRFFNRDIENVRESVWGECHHPHVNQNGEGCLGNASTLIAECVMNREWAVLADVLINYLESINTDDSAGKHYVNWDEVDDEGNTVEPTHDNGERRSKEDIKRYQRNMYDAVKDGRYVANIEYKEVK